MKLLTALLVGAVIGSGAFAIEYATSNTYSESDWYVAMKFDKTGKLLQLSDRYASHYECTLSNDFQIHNAMAKESNANILCTNKPITYKL
jgi:hypothetical protein